MLRFIMSLVSISAYYNAVLPINAQEQCFIDMKNCKSEPVVLSRGQHEFLYPQSNQTKILVPPNAQVLVACPQREGTYSRHRSWDARCIRQFVFRLSSHENRQLDTICNNKAFNTARFMDSCGYDQWYIEIGFKIDQERFVRLILICYNIARKTPSYVYYRMTKSVMNRLRPSKSITFIQSPNIPPIFDINQLYLYEKQKSTINRLVGLNRNAEKYISKAESSFLTRGHIGAKGDFLYEYQKRAVTNYANAAPQWKNFNSGNWQNIELDIRQYVTDRRVDLDIYSGTYGISTLPHERTRQQIPLYLYVDWNPENNAIPVPDIFWKVLYNPITQEGIAFIIHNNPFKENDHERYICDDISERITWLRVLRSPRIYGHGYACAVDALRNYVKYLPPLKVAKIMY